MEKMMRNAAGQIWPHLPQGTPDEVEQRRTGSLADALYPRPQEPRLSPDQVKELWRDHMLALMGLRRIK
jgi:hypothetical protein